jgi:hypothetical protein
MNKTIWMCWLQGRHHKSIPKLNRVCLCKWGELNPTWNTVILDSNTIGEYLPEYGEIVGRAKYKRAWVHHGDLVRLLLLKKYGGIWSDASVYPVTPLDDWLESAINHTGFFAYRFSPRNQNRETASWFLAVNQPHHQLIESWCEKFTDTFINLKKMVWFQIHRDLSYVYDTNTSVRNIIENMVQIDQSIPHSPSRSSLGNGKGWEGRIESYMYKRPRLPAGFAWDVPFDPSDDPIDPYMHPQHDKP